MRSGITIGRVALGYSGRSSSIPMVFSGVRFNIFVFHDGHHVRHLYGLQFLLGKYRFDPNQSLFTALCVVGEEDQEIVTNGYKWNVKKHIAG